MRTILIVDDDPVVLSAGELLFRTTGNWRTLTASDGASAVAMALELSPDVVLLDRSLPDMADSEILEQLDQAGAELSVVLMSAHRTDHQTVGAMPKVVGILEKPFDSQSMVAQLESIVDRGRI